ncbi:MAG TPA: metal ABC transporter substrate-binding protein, partial [Dehalococcoidia bacterium]|nr:metal ABC transporter substrate-binding protein [Dehalococcoidia bacterium]
MLRLIVVSLISLLAALACTSQPAGQPAAGSTSGPAGAASPASALTAGSPVAGSTTKTASPSPAAKAAAASPSPAIRAASPAASPGAAGPAVQLGWTDELQDNGKLNVATTVAPISSIVRNIGGNRINLRGIVPDGSDSHTFEPAPSDARILSQADLVIVNGLALEEPTIQLAEANLKPGATIQRLGENTITPDQYAYDFSFPRENGDPNPHLWTNIKYAQKYADLTRQWLGE